MRTLFKYKAIMRASRVSQFVFVQVVAILCAVTHSNYATLTKDPGPKNFTPIGTVDGKTYYAEQFIIGTWAECKSFCNAHSMYLATITSAQQRLVLDNALWATPESYWTGGRDSQRASQFVWDRNDETLSYNFSAPAVYIPALTCVYYFPPNKRFGTEACTKKFIPLCELFHEK